MVRGIEKFHEYFKDFQNEYVLIGGSACDLTFNYYNSSFRATKDLDIVLIVEAQTKEFGLQFWNFIRDGGYQNRMRSDNKMQFYRFDKPSNPDFPQMIELFSRIEGVFDDQSIIPIHIDQSLSSLSAILLNKFYYDILLRESTLIKGISVLKPESIILFKMKAYLDLKKRKENFENIDNRDIRKHRNDILRLVNEIPLVNQMYISKEVEQDVLDFIDALRNEEINFKSLKLNDITTEDVIEILERIYL